LSPGIPAILASGMHEGETESGQRGSEAEAEGYDQRHPVADPVERDGG
jgi:hypothetical protein